MNTIIEKYVKTKRFTDKVNRDLTVDEIQALEEVIKKYGDTAFTRKKSSLKDRVINDTIPNMIKHNVLTIVENLENIKNVQRNSLDHYRLLFGKSANDIYSARTTKSLQTEKNFIERHGEIKGKELWAEFSEKKSKKSSYTNSKEWYIENFGKDAGLKKWEEVVYKRTYKKWTLEGLVEKYGSVLGNEKYLKLLNDRKTYPGYARKVHSLSQKTYEENIDIINPDRHTRTLCGVKDGYQLDHIMSVRECFEKNIPPKKAASIENLRMLPWKENLMRQYD